MPDSSMRGTNAADFRPQADDVFGRIASRYDLLCDLFSLGLHRLWKRRIAQLIATEPWDTLLDCAAGTGDVSLRVLRHTPITPNQRLIVSDISVNMLSIAQQRIGSHMPGVSFSLLDAHAMPQIADASVDLFSISLGLKICERERVLREAWHVLKPGGRLIALEASNIRPQWLHGAYLGYMRIVMPLIGRIATGGDASAYRYLLKGVTDFPGAETLALELTALGYQKVRFERLSLGIVAIHTARKADRP